MKQKSSAAPRLLQTIFIASTLIFFVSQLGMNIYYFMLGLNGNISADYTSTYLFSLIWMVAPIVMWAIVHFTRRDRKLSVSSLFQSLLLTFCAMIVMTTLGSVLSPLSMYLPGTADLVNGMWWYTLMSIGLPLVITVCGLVAVILRLRRLKQW